MYKRQLLEQAHQAAPQNAPVVPDIFIEPSRKGIGIQGIAAVSYTHLDVYKRQLQDRRRALEEERADLTRQIEEAAANRRRIENTIDYYTVRAEKYLSLIHI